MTTFIKEPALLFDLPNNTPPGTPSAVSCPALIAPMRDMQRLDSFYTGDGSQSDIDGNALASYSTRVAPIVNQKAAFQTLIEKALAEPVNRADASACIIAHLNNWAANGGFGTNLLGLDGSPILDEGVRANTDEQHHQAVLEIAWATLAFGTAYTVALKGDTVARHKRGLIDRWLEQLGDTMIQHQTPQTRMTSPTDQSWIDGMSNRLYAVAAAVAITATFTRNAHHWYWSMGVLETILDEAPSNGQLPAEIGRGVRALQYSCMAATMMILLAHVAARNGYLLSQGRQDKLAAVCHFAARYYNDPAGVSTEVGVGTQVNTGTDLIGFAELAAHYFATRNPAVSQYVRAAAAPYVPVESPFFAMPWSQIWGDPGVL